MELTSDTFDDEVLRSAGSLLVAFRAAGCGSCHALAPTLAALAAEFAGRASVASVDVEDQPGLAAAYGIRAVPSLLFFQRGKLVQQVSGVVPGPVLSECLEGLTTPDYLEGDAR